ncbi:MAG: rhodanese-like domain-containing protein [Candidatus Dormibacteria bacterium]
MQEVDLAHFSAAHQAGAVVVDVREPYEYARGHVPGSLLIPMGHVPMRVAELPTDKPVYVICASGARSLTAAAHMAAAGLDARSVAGGVVAWARAGRPLER